MSRPDQLSTSQNARTCGENDDRHNSRSGRLTKEQLRRWAALIAKGDTEFPEDLDEIDRDLLHGHCRVLLRNRLVHLVARAIALDIRRDGGQDGKV
jgi:hypothetical protein